MPRRVLSLWFPRLASDRLLRRRMPGTRADTEAGTEASTGAASGAGGEAAFAVTLRQSNMERIHCLNHAAAALGLAPGMSASDARALVPGLQSAPADLPAEARFLHLLCRWAGRYSPWVGLEGRDGLVLDVTGAAHLFGGEAMMLADIGSRMARAGISLRSGLADTRGAAKPALGTARRSAPGLVRRAVPRPARGAPEWSTHNPPLRPAHAPARQTARRLVGVPLFQEQAMQIAVVGAGFTPEEADRLRRSLATFRRMGTIGTFKDRFTKGMLERGYDMEFAERCFGQIEGFGEYGFPESHAAAFAMLAYVSAWLKCHHPAAFACALLNSQPMGFYAPAQIVRDARDHQIELRPVCVNNSAWDNCLERRSDGSLALRLGFRQIKGFREEAAGWIVAARGNGYPDPESLWQRAGIKPAALERLAEADAFADMGLGRRNALWRIKAMRSAQVLPLFNDPIEGESIQEPTVTLPAMHLGQEVVEDYVAMRLSLRAHPMELLRPAMPGLTPHAALVEAPLCPTTVCGLVITRQRPGTASGVVFLTLEDETGVSNVIVWPKVYEQFRREVMGGRLLRIRGMLQREGIVVHMIAQKIEDCSELLAALGHPGEDAIGETLPQADDVAKGLRAGHARAARHPRDQAKALFPSRDFH
jgi:helix-hairpin-helix protein/DNA polymerase III alpha subunit/impB/mucB/samB family protein/OB-fold nucleic acid binding protein